MPSTGDKLKAYQKDYQKKWYSDPDNAAKKKLDAKKHRLATKERNRKFIRDYKVEKGCSTCPERRPACLDAHHRSNKKFNIADMLTYGQNTILIELAKCDIMCRNCHAVLHENEREKSNL